ncbi:hypothetical protein ACFPN1_15520 [Lysobacter yangpyeongensis]|uniref:Uncharacterized protein n=1 Tax=Lysobacter yangpyeongensis TaxID=346182 RepID=A0ABW0SRE4_9GAMM
MNVIKMLTLAVMATGMFALAPAAHALDSKNSNGAECQPYSTTTLPSELSFRANGLKNISANTEYVVCNVNVDADNPTIWTDANPADVYVTFHTPTAATPRCELYIGSNLDGTPVSYVQQANMTAGQVANLNFLSASGTGVVSSFMATYPVSLYCRMPPNSSIVRIRVVESATATN